MDFQIVGFVFAIIGVIASVVWFVFLRRGVRALEKGSAALQDMRDKGRRDEN